MNPTIALHEKVLLLLQLSIKLDQIVDSQDPDRFTMDEGTRQDLENSCRAFLLMWSDVQKCFTQDDKNALFHITIKAHMLVHACLLSASPRRTWCFRGEDVMQKMRRVCFSCSKRSPPWEVGNKAIRKYSIALRRTFKKVAVKITCVS